MYRWQRDFLAALGGPVVKRNSARIGPSHRLAGWATALAALIALAACGGAEEPTSGAANSSAGATGTGAASLNVAQCDPAGGWKSAVQVATGAKDLATLEKYAAALSGAGYRAALHLGPDAASGDATTGADGLAGAADAADGGSLDASAADAAEGEPAADAQASDASAGDSASVDTADASTPVEGGSDPTPVDAETRVFVIATDPRQDAVILMENGDLFVASACPLDRLGQARRLDFGLAQAVQTLTKIDHPGEWKLETQRWARPDAFYTATAGLYWRQYVHDAVDLQKPLQGTISLASAPLGLALGVYGHVDLPSAVGDVVRMNSLTVAGKKLASGETWPIGGLASLVWDLAKAMAAGELPFRAELLVADASVEWNVGIYHVFFEALFGKGDQGLGVSTQGALPGQLRVSKPIAEAKLPALPADL